jgi:AmmeMemoRadiSam system protein B
MLPLQTPAGQRVLLRDPLRLAESEIAVPADIAFLIAQFDGTHTVREAQVSYVRRFGSLITTNRINQLLRQLDDALLLDTDRFRKFAAEIEAEFRSRPTRAAAHAGRSYEEGAAALIQAWAPRLQAASIPGDFALDQRRPALIAPHYDMNNAAEAYAVAYKLLQNAPQPDVVVILGTAHSGRESPFILTRKPFETPLGALETDAVIIDRLAEAASFDIFADEFIHRDEHSIEFQAVLLHFLYHEAEEPPKIVPILCGGYHRRNGEFVDPADEGPVNGFLEALREALGGDERRIALIASADLSHIGARFGQPPPLTQAHLDLARRHDMAILDRAQRGDTENLYFTVAEVQDRYNVCGFPCIYALLQALPVKEGRLLSYKQATEPQTQSCVSFASVALR